MFVENKMQIRHDKEIEKKLQLSEEPMANGCPSKVHTPKEENDCFQTPMATL